MYNVLVGDKTYKVQADKNGNPVMISRYNEKFGMFIDITFCAENNGILKAEVEILLKSLYTSRILGLT